MSMQNWILIMFVRLQVLIVLIFVVATSSGCDVTGLKRASDAIDGLRRQIHDTTGPGGDLDRLLREFHADLAGLIDKAIREGGELEDKFVFDFIEQKKDVFLRFAELEKKVFSDVDL